MALHTAGGTTVLVVDDDRRMLAGCREILQAGGYRVLVARDGPEAIHVFRIDHNSIGAVILDWVLPGMRGDEILDRLLEIDPQARVVFFSGYPHLLDEATGRRLAGKVRGFLKKPFTAQQLLDAVHHALHGAKGGSSGSAGGIAGAGAPGEASVNVPHRRKFTLPGLYDLLLLLAVLAFVVAVVIYAMR
ncbi:MAG: response regulator [Armatimonadetes bacterium]|nr:response regulator [Armatimonadota bacterium]